MSIRHMKKEIPGSHYFSFFALSNLLAQTWMNENENEIVTEMRPIKK